MVTHAAWSLPGCGPVDVVHVENSAVAVDTGLPVWSEQRRRTEHVSEAAVNSQQASGFQLVPGDKQKLPHKFAY